VGRSGRGGKSRPHRDSIPDRPARSQSLYRLSYPAHRICNKYHNSKGIVTFHKFCLRSEGRSCEKTKSSRSSCVSVIFDLVLVTEFFSSHMLSSCPDY